jgi:hypothetical protein
VRCHSVLVRSVAAALAALMLWSCRGLEMMHVSEAYPFFHQLEIFGDRLTVVSPDSETLRGLTFEGREVWRRSIVGDPLVARDDEGHLYIQEHNGGTPQMVRRCTPTRRPHARAAGSQAADPGTRLPMR